MHKKCWLNQFKRLCVVITVEKPYEKLKALTRGQAMTRDMMVDFVNGNELEAVPAADRARLAEMTPATYTGNAAEQAKQIKEFNC